MITFNTTPRFAAMPSATPALPQSQQPAAHSESAAQPMFGAERRRRRPLIAALMAAAIGLPVAAGASGCGTDTAGAVDGNGSSSSASAPANPGQGQLSKAIEMYKTKTANYKSDYVPVTWNGKGALEDEGGIDNVNSLKAARAEAAKFINAMDVWPRKAAPGDMSEYFGEGAIKVKYGMTWQLDRYEGTVALWLFQINTALTEGKDKAVGKAEWDKIVKETNAKLAPPGFKGDVKASLGTSVSVLDPDNTYDKLRIKTLKDNGVDIEKNVYVVKKNADGKFSIFLNKQATVDDFMEALQYVMAGQGAVKAIGSATADPVSFRLPSDSVTKGGRLLVSV